MNVKKQVGKVVGGGLLTVVASLGCGLIVLGCSDGDGGGGGGVSNAAIAATLPTLTGSLAARSTTINGSVTQGTIGNPTALTPSGTDASVTLGGSANDGTAASVNVIRTLTTNANGSGTFTVQVQETTTNFEFATATVNYDAPSVSYRQAGISYDALAADGTGTAFVIVRVVESGDISTTLVNTSTSGATLLDFTSVQPAQVDGTRTATFQTTVEYLLEFEIVLAGGTLTADLTEIRDWSDSGYVRRSGGPATSAISLDVTALALGGTNLNGNDQNLVMAVGPDSGATTTFVDGASLALSVNVSGGVTGESYETDVEGEVTPEIDDSPALTVNYTGALEVLGTPPVSDGGLDTDAEIEISSDNDEDVLTSGDLQTTIDNQLGEFSSLEDLLYLPSRAFASRSYRLIH